MDANNTPQYDVNILGQFLRLTLLRVDVIKILLAESTSSSDSAVPQEQCKQWRRPARIFITAARSHNVNESIRRYSLIATNILENIPY